MRVLPAVLAAAACGHRTAAPPAPAPPAITIVVSEVGALGARLVVLDEHGDRQAALLRDTPGRVRDTNPAISPDGKWIVFESSRDRSDGKTSLWIAPLQLDAVPQRLTTGALDREPVWAPDGKSILFARAGERADWDPSGEHFDLYRLTLANHELDRISNEPGDEVTPSVAPDGQIFYCEVAGSGAQLEAHDPHDITRYGALSHGPAETSPAVSPDGKWIVYSAPIPHHGIPDADLWLMSMDGVTHEPLVELPISDESGPVWSPDGRYVFATSVVRSIVDGRVLASSVIAIDVETRKTRILQDRSGYIPRLTPAIAPRPLDRTALASDPEYVPALVRLLAKAVDAQQQEPR